MVCLVPMTPNANRNSAFAACPGKKTQVIRPANVKLVEQNLSGDRKDRRICADPQRQRSNRNRRKSRTLRQHPQRIAKVGSQLVEPPGAPRLPALLFSRCQTSQLCLCPSYRPLARNTSAHQIFSKALDVEPQLLIHLRIDLRSAPHRAPPCL